MIAAFTAGLALGALGLGVRLYMGRAAEDRLAPPERIAIAALRSPLPKPAFLACPPGYCTAAEAVASPAFAMPWERLRDYWVEMIGAEHGIVQAAADPQARRLVYIQHSPLLRFPDIVTVEFVALGADRCSIAVYSRSRYGRYDFAKNRKRVEHWLFLLQTIARPQARGGAHASARGPQAAD